MLDALSPQRRRLVLGAGALGVLLVLVALVATLVGARSGAVAPVPQDRPGPVLLVPGYGGDGRSLEPLAVALRAAGRQAVVVPPVGDGTGDLTAQAEHLDGVARTVLAESGAPSVDVVGYSAGGVVARLWVRAGGGSAARRVLTLGSPHHGSTQAARGLELAGGCPTACRQLVPDSDLLRRLNAGDETPDGPAWVTLRSTGDQVVTPAGSAALEGALNVVVSEVCPGSRAAHGDLPTSPVTLGLLRSALGSDAPTVPTAVAC